ncbi:uncharacterized protein AB675_4898 [Cyphellophora attinorum]|uniref:Uncharacterized protein n=1 Tax=Cyphellophora attinorum TaxID=1664694 RepID=A0A0N1NV92_9EURO|nr:uncharacterized protein AB675_4898 [Phialophora attinorum]KPI34373.1 hypothetical protein AB675_4898 [Phialophora attinorum]
MSLAQAMRDPGQWLEDVYHEIDQKMSEIERANMENSTKMNELAREQKALAARLLELASRYAQALYGEEFLDVSEQMQSNRRAQEESHRKVIELKNARVELEEKYNTLMDAGALWQIFADEYDARPSTLFDVADEYEAEEVADEEQGALHERATDARREEMLADERAVAARPQDELSWVPDHGRSEWSEDDVLMSDGMTGDEQLLYGGEDESYDNDDEQHGAENSGADSNENVSEVEQVEDDLDYNVRDDQRDLAGAEQDHESREDEVDESVYAEEQYGHDVDEPGHDMYEPVHELDESGRGIHDSEDETRDSEDEMRDSEDEVRDLIHKFSGREIKLLRRNGANWSLPAEAHSADAEGAVRAEQEGAAVSSDDSASVSDVLLEDERLTGDAADVAAYDDEEMYEAVADDPDADDEIPHHADWKDTAEELFLLAFEATDEDEEDFRAQLRHRMEVAQDLAKLEKVVDEYCIGAMTAAAEVPGKCFFGKLARYGKVKGGPTSTRGSCPFCNKYKKQNCYFVYLAPGVHSGYGPRIGGIIPDDGSRKWGQQEPRTVTINGSQVRWIVKKKKQTGKVAGEANPLFDVGNGVLI